MANTSTNSTANDVAVSLRVEQIFVHILYVVHVVSRVIYNICASVFNETEIRTCENNAYADDVKSEKDLCVHVSAFCSVSMCIVHCVQCVPSMQL